jgi:hypothetical protein
MSPDSARRSRMVVSFTARLPRSRTDTWLGCRQKASPEECPIEATSSALENLRNPFR